MNENQVREEGWLRFGEIVQRGEGYLHPAVFLTSGGLWICCNNRFKYKFVVFLKNVSFSWLSKECKQFVNRIIDLIARKRKERYCDVVRHVRTRIRFAMIRTTVIALLLITRVIRKESGHQTWDPSIRSLIQSHPCSAPIMD